MTNYTPEIWFARHDDGKYRNPDHWRAPDHEKHAYSSAAPVVDSNGKLVAYVCAATSSSEGFAAIDEIIELRARLIAAAPDLLEALKCLTSQIFDQEIIIEGDDKQKALAALAKATGESNA